MNKKEIINYVMCNLPNVNLAVLRSILETADEEITNIEEILDYINYTSYNTNRAVLETLIKAEEPSPEQWVTVIDVTNYIVPNSEHTPTVNPWLWTGNYDLYIEGVFVDGVPKTMIDWHIENDEYVVMVFDSFYIAIKDGYGSYFTSEVRYMNPPSEVTFGRLIFKYLEE